MVGWFTSGGFLLVVLAAMVVEAVVLVGVYRRTGQGVRPSSLLLGLASGALMVVACGAACLGAGWWVVGGVLLLAGGLHGLDVWGRWGRPPHPGAATHKSPGQAGPE